MELLQFFELIDHNRELSVDSDLSPTVFFECSFLSGIEWSLMVLASTRLSCLRDNPAHEVQLTVVESDQDSEVKHVVALAHIGLAGLTKVSDGVGEVGLDLIDLLTQLLVIQSRALALV